MSRSMESALPPVPRLRRATDRHPLAAQFLQTMKDYPPSQSPGSFNLTKIEEKLRTSASR
jgi:hypothetical protein